MSRQISIHALRVEGDAGAVRLFKKIDDFYPRPPGGGRRKSIFGGGLLLSISIHALRVEGDRFHFL